MNTPEPCCRCKNLYVNAMTKDNPNDRAQCFSCGELIQGGCDLFEEVERLDNHITVTLRFIPVEEGLPEEDGYYFVMEKGISRFEGKIANFFDAQWWCDETNRVLDVTHYAEIPPISHAGGEGE